MTFFAFSRASMALRPSAWGWVKEMSVRLVEAADTCCRASAALGPPGLGGVEGVCGRAVEAADRFCTAMSRLISGLAMARKIDAGSAGLSGTPAKVALASEVS